MSEGRPATPATASLAERQTAVPAAQAPRSTVATALVAGLVVSALYLARDVLVPIALAILLSFVLAPMVRFQQRQGVPRVLSVAFAVLVATSIIASLIVMVAVQVSDLATTLPTHLSTIIAKVRALQDALPNTGVLDRFYASIDRLGREFGVDAVPAPPGEAADRAAVPVEVREPGGPVAALRQAAAYVLGPLGVLGLVLLFSVFILMQKEDLRNRLIRLAGSQDLHRTTLAIDDAARRLSRLFLAQLMLNAGYGAAVAAGMWLIGVPGAVLFGVLAGVLRFVPYLGAVAGALMPILVAIAVDPGWSMMVQAGLFFLIVEPIVGHFLEPLLFGRSAGLSPVAVVVAATFWTWLWGPIGLLLATPLTVCLVVLGRHVERLEFLSVLFGDEPPLTPAQRFYQRVLANDPEEALVQAERYLEDRPLAAYLDEVALPGLLLAEADAERGNLTPDRMGRLRDSIVALTDDLETGAEAAGAEPQAPAILVVAGRHALDEAAALLFAELMRGEGHPVEVLTAAALRRPEAAGREGGAALVVLSLLNGARIRAQLPFRVRRVRRMLPRTPVLLAAWGEAESVTEEAGLIETAKADGIARTFEDARRQAGMLLKLAEGEPAPAGRSAGAA